MQRDLSEKQARRKMKSTSTGSGRSGMVERPVVQYAAPDGQLLEFVPKVGSARTSFRVGQEVPLYVVPDDPEVVKLVSFNTLWLPVVILFGMGFLVLGVTWLVGRLVPKQTQLRSPRG